MELVDACASGRVGSSECGPVWQLGVIMALLVVMTTLLLVLRLRARLLADRA